ncbi:nucleotide pyrophosphohydrolase [Tautonia sociabilis]|uniref:Nucleotide pyrophosphohydrolase n=1 Tax=Tautonia sociabilis TaxID=2080755 RepID=A0A432MGV9_9BACT|nr:nucleotide pyrophosphohydrolase [Tautonia sociabilis]RUL86138.1 nucleotide pyrophosphohydrolase [Tautonia sociabilis]
MNDDETTVRELKRLVRGFSRERDWEQFHLPKDLGLCLAIEAGEVLEHFRFRTNREIAAALDDPARKQALAHELADCLWALLRLADVCTIDLAGALEEKIALAARKYPVDLASGKAEKYTAYLEDDEETASDGRNPV